MLCNTDGTITSEGFNIIMTSFVIDEKNPEYKKDRFTRSRDFFKKWENMTPE